MSYRLAMAAMLATSTCGLHAQDPQQAQKARITSSLNKCVGQPGPSQQGMRSCLGNDWYGHLQEENQRCAVSVKQQAEKAAGECKAQVKTATENAVLADRAARRAGGQSAVQQFLTTFAENQGRDLEFISVNAGTVLVRTQAGDAAVLLPFPSLARAFAQEKDTQLRFECTPESGNCISLLSKDGVLTKYGAVWFPITATQFDTLLKRANGAIQAFK